MMGVNRVNQAEEFMVEIKQFLTGDQTTVLTEEMKEILMEEMLNSVRIFQIAVPLLSNLALASSLLLFPRPNPPASTRPASPSPDCASSLIDAPFAYRRDSSL